MDSKVEIISESSLSIEDSESEARLSFDRMIEMMTKVQNRTISLTGKDSHIWTLPPGVGGITIGHKDMKRKPDLIVATTDTINWNVFNDMKAPCGYLLPRFIHYEGDDLSVFQWAENRRIEELEYKGCTIQNIDASNSRISQFAIIGNGNDQNIYLPSKNHCNTFIFEGNPKTVQIYPHKDGSIPDITLNLKSISKSNVDNLLTPSNNDGYKIPEMGRLGDLSSLRIETSPLSTPVDCRSLLQFKKLKSLILIGAYTNLDVLKNIPIGTLKIWYCPDLSSIPFIKEMPNLESIFICDCDAITSKKLRTELRSMDLGSNSAVHQARSRNWFIEEYGLPFTDWPRKSSKVATKAFKSTSKEIVKATCLRDVKIQIENFVHTMNTLPNIETIEREDIFGATQLLQEISPYKIGDDELLDWVDQIREF